MVKHEIQVDLEEEAPLEPPSVIKTLGVLTSQTTASKALEKAAQNASQPVLQPAVPKKTAQSNSSSNSKTTPQNATKTVPTVTTPALPAATAFPKFSAVRLSNLVHDEASSPTSMVSLPRSTMGRRNSPPDGIVANSIPHDTGFVGHTNGMSLSNFITASRGPRRTKGDGRPTLAHSSISNDDNISQTGIAGELIVYNQLKSILGACFGPDNWTSELRHLADASLPEWTPADDTTFYADITYRDEDNLLASYLVSEHGCTAPDDNRYLRLLRITSKSRLRVEGQVNHFI